MAYDLAELTDPVDADELLELLAAARTAAAVTVVPRPGHPTVILEGHLVDGPEHTLGNERPDNVVQLIYLMWMSLDWRRAATASFLVSACGVAVGMALGGLALLVVGVSPLWVAGSGLLVAGGAAAGAYRFARRDRGDSHDPPP